jgi:hypothetical protein
VLLVLLFYALLCKCVVFVLLQNVLRELEQKKPQLDELVHTAEHLKADSNRQQLHGKGEYILFFPLFSCHFARMREKCDRRVFSMRHPHLLQTHPLPFVLICVRRLSSLVLPHICVEGQLSPLFECCDLFEEFIRVSDMYWLVLRGRNV